MGTGAIIHMPSFPGSIKIGSGIEEVLWWGTYTDTQIARCFIVIFFLFK
jgi:hypothetical protein